MERNVDLSYVNYQQTELVRTKWKVLNCLGGFLSVSL